MAGWPGADRVTLGPFPGLLLPPGSLPGFPGRVGMGRLLLAAPEASEGQRRVAPVRPGLACVPSHRPAPPRAPPSTFLSVGAAGVALVLEVLSLRMAAQCALPEPRVARGDTLFLAGCCTLAISTAGQFLSLPVTWPVNVAEPSESQAALNIPRA